VEDSPTIETSRIDIKAAIRAAKTMVSDLLEGESYSQLGLEEVKYDSRSDHWLITLGFNRPWDVEKQVQTAGMAIYAGPTTTTRQMRTLKKVTIDGKTGEFISMED
jgi:predicted lactoylglutathione lyase